MSAAGTTRLRGTAGPARHRPGLLPRSGWRKPEVRFLTLAAGPENLPGAQIVHGARLSDRR